MTDNTPASDDDPSIFRQAWNVLHDACSSLSYEDYDPIDTAVVPVPDFTKFEQESRKEQDKVNNNFLQPLEMDMDSESDSTTEFPSSISDTVRRTRSKRIRTRRKCEAPGVNSVLDGGEIPGVHR